MKVKVAFLVGLLGGLVALGLAGLMGTVWSVATYEGAAGVSEAPTNASQASDIDDFIRDGRQELRYRTEVESCFGPNNQGCPAAGTGAGDNGRMREGSARPFMDNAQPANLARADYHNTTGASGSGTDALDDGRLWVDSNSTPYVNQLKVYDEVIDAQWENVSLATGVADDEILAGSYNLIYNGSFEATDGTGDATSTTVPEEWVLVDGGGGGNPTIAYVNPSNDTDYGDGYNVTVTDVGGGGTDAIYQRLTFREAAVFKVMARVDSDGANTCRLTTSGAAVESGDLDTTSAVWTTLSGTFTTASPDTVDIYLTTVTAGHVCSWDHVNVYRVGDVTADRPEIAEPGVFKLEGIYPEGTGDLSCGITYGVGNCAEAATGLFVVVTVPTAGQSLVMLEGNVYLYVVVGHECYLRLYDVTNAVVLYEEMYAYGGLGGADTRMYHAHRITLQEAGTTVTYALQIRSDLANQCILENNNPAGEEFDSVLNAVVMAPR